MSGQVSYLQTAAVIVNQAIDILGEPAKIIGDITDGTPVSEAARRNYGQVLRQLLRTAHWDFARKRAALTLLGNATGSTLGIGVSAFVECPWSFAYAWPTDAVCGRWLPWNPSNAVPENIDGVPLTTGNSAIVQYSFQPGRFLVASSDQYPIEVGLVPWDQQPDLQRTEGLGPTNRKIILTDCCNAEFVYTRLVTVIEEMDALFRQALVTAIALVIAPSVIDDPKRRFSETSRLVPILKNAIADARVANGNESGWPQSTDFEASFIRARSQWGNAWGTGIGVPLTGGVLGVFGCGWESCSFGGSVF